MPPGSDPSPRVVSMQHTFAAQVGDERSGCGGALLVKDRGLADWSLYGHVQPAVERAVDLTTPQMHPASAREIDGLVVRAEGLRPALVFDGRHEDVAAQE